MSRSFVMMMRVLVSAAVVGTTVFSITGCNPAREVSVSTTQRAGLVPATGATPTARGTVALTKLQHPGGGFTGPTTPDHVGVTAIAGLALLSASDVAPSTVAPNIDRATTFIMKSQKTSGYLHRDGDGAGMYGHAFATLFLTQVYEKSRDEGLKGQLQEPIRKAIQLIEKAQSPQGGWRYNPEPKDADVSVTAAQLKALSAAKEAGFAVSEKTLMSAVSYLKSAQQPDGGFAYVVGGGNSGWARSAAATAALLYAGVQSPDTEKAMDYLQKRTTEQNFFFYGNYYLAQTLNLGDPEKTASGAAVRSALLEKQDKTKHLWAGEAGEAYATAMALLVLYMPDTRLPAFRAPKPAVAPASTAPASP